MGRMTQTLKTAKYSFIAQFVKMLLNFLSKTIFLRVLGVEYSGLNGLFANILGVLALSELGIGSAMTFALYKPAAYEDTEKLKTLMQFYKKVYRVVACLITLFGLILLPFLKYMIKGAETVSIDSAQIYYLVYLFNTVIGYFVAYKSSLLYANQKSYVVTNIDMVFNSLIILTQITVLLVFKSFLIYILAGALWGIVRQLYTNHYINKLYPFLKDKNYNKISKEELHPIKKNIKALMLHNLGSVGVGQTDNILISSLISISVTGCVSYYTMVINAVNSIIGTIASASVSSIGNLVAKESRDKQESIIEKYMFVNFWLFGFSAVAFYILLSPFVTVLWGQELLLDDLTVLCIVVAGYATSQMGCLNYIKSAAGIFDEDKFVPVFQTVINLVVSALLAKKIGITGIYLGTITQAVFAWIWKAVVTYKVLFQKSAKKYFIKQLFYILLVALAGGVCTLAKRQIVGYGVNILTFLMLAAVVAVVTNLIFLIVFCRSREFKYMKDTALRILKQKLKRSE